MPITFRLLSDADERALDHVAEGVFDHPVIAEQWQAFLMDRRHVIAVAEDRRSADAVVVGFVSGVHYLHPDKRPQCWINEVSTAPTHRRRGIASALLRLVVDRARAIGCTQIWLATEADNEPARALYRSFGADETPIVMFDLS
ncbi:MAG: GNAT family N-acetyltransferase [Planctomycetota bacterium]